MQILEKHENAFFDVVDAKFNLLKLNRKKVINEDLIARIEGANNENAQEILFHHLKCNADVAALREYCKVVIAADAFPKMQELGVKMLSELPPEGLLEWCVCVCVCDYLYFIHYIYCLHQNCFHCRLIRTVASCTTVGCSDTELLFSSQHVPHQSIYFTTIVKGLVWISLAC